MSTAEDEIRDGPEETNDRYDNISEEKAMSSEAAALPDGPEDQSPTRLSFKGYSKRPYNLQNEGIDSPSSSLNGRDRPSSAEGSTSIPDDSPSAQGSLVSTPHRGARAGSYSQSPTLALRPFDRRFQARLSSSQFNTPRSASPAFLSSHSRTSSAAFAIHDGRDTEVEVPWEVVRWTKLKKMNGHAFSEIGKRKFGRPTCIAVSASIALGTSKGMILLFDYNQNNTSIIGPGTKAVEAGAVTSLSISADHSTIASGHASGSIFTWEVARPGKPFLHIPPTDRVRSPSIDGHQQDAAVLHLGFLAIRHTALSSADDKGMAFSHLATRGMGVVARSVKTTRILGRYSDRSTAPSTRKPSSVLSFSTMPLGNIEHAADDMGLVAMLTPYLLVVVSTMPIAQTQFKSPRPKEVASHSAMTGALAWFPSVRVKKPGTSGNEASSKAKLAYCWSNVLTVLDVIEVEPSDNKNEPPALQFKPRSRWRAEEAIVAIQWLSRSVIAVLTITQQLVILEEHSMMVTDTSDLLHKHVYHTDLFSDQLNALVDHLGDDDEEASMHGVVADAFYMSFRAYKGRLFLLGHNDISFGTLSNWADRLHALVEEGSYIRAIKLANDYYMGSADKVTVGLPDDDASRHGLVREKLLDLMQASLTFAFGKAKRTFSLLEQRQHLDELAQACINACVSTQALEFLFEEIYPWYQENDAASIFLEDIETAIDAQEIKVLPPEVTKDFVNYYIAKDMSSRLEEILCVLDPRTMDLDQVTTLCRANRLYDALLYVWSQAIGDYTTILSELIHMGLPSQNGVSSFDAESEAQKNADASKVFPYLSYILTGRIYPTGKMMDDDQANLAKAEIYNFFFSGKGTDGVPRRDTDALSPKPGSSTSFANLRRILHLDAPSFLSMLNEGFEDSFLNGPQERLSDEKPGGLTEAQRFGLSVNRQWVMSILIEVLTAPSYEPDDVVYLNMFIARNLPKFPQFILLPGHTLQNVLVGLCDYPSDDIAEECQLSVEYLLSMYQPPDMSSLISKLQTARFFRVLKSVYKGERRYAQLLRTCFGDQGHEEDAFDCIVDCLRPGAGLNEGQIDEIRTVIVEHAEDLVALNVTQLAEIVEQYIPELHTKLIATIADRMQQFQYLRVILESSRHETHVDQKGRHALKTFIEQYVRLMCTYEPSHVSIYVDSLKTGDLRLEEVLPALEGSGVIDAAVVLMARDGKVQEGIDRLTKHMQKLESALIGLLKGVSGEDAEHNSAEEAVQDLIDSFGKYARVGIWLCQCQARTAARSRAAVTRRKSGNARNDPLSADENMWLDLLDAVVTTVKNATEILERLKRSRQIDEDQSEQLEPEIYIVSLRTVVQDTFTALLTTTTTPSKGDSHRSDISFLRILRAFLTRASISSPTLSNLRGVLSAIFSAYSYEEGLLSLSNKLLDKDLFIRVSEVDRLRRRGWRPLGQVCEACNKRVWGPGAGPQIWDDFQRSVEERQAANAAKLLGDAPQSRKLSDLQGRGKGKAVTRDEDDDRVVGPDDSEYADKALDPPPGSGPIVVFACRHVFHRSCLVRMQSSGNEGGAEGGQITQQLTCPLDG